MANSRSFQLIGTFTDRISPKLRDITKAFDNLSKQVKGLSRDADNLAGDWSKSFKSIEKSITTTSKAFRSFEDGAKGAQNSITDFSKGTQAAMLDTGASIKSLANSFDDVIAKAKQAGEAIRDAQGGGGGGGGAGDRGGGFTIAKGVAANLASGFIETVTSGISGVITGVANYAVGQIQKGMQDELDDIGTAGGIFSIGKLKNLSFANTYDKAVQIQKELDSRMGTLAAALPGETDQYVENAKKMTDSIIQIAGTQGPELIKAMQQFDSGVKDQKGAFLAATQELSKYATLTDVLSPSGGQPMAMLSERLLSMQTINVQSLKNQFGAIESNPLLSGALERHTAELNAATAGSAKRLEVMIKVFKEMYPPEVLAAMQNSVDGTFQAMKSYITSMQTGLFGIKRTFGLTQKGFSRIIRDGEKVNQTLDVSLYDMGAKIFQAIGLILGPILENLPRIFDPLQAMGKRLQEFYYNAQNTISNYNAALKKYSNMMFKDAPLRAALEAGAKLAKAMGGDVNKVNKLMRSLTQKDLDPGAAIQQLLEVITSSKLMERLGFAIGSAIGSLISSLSNMVSGITQGADQSGFAKGFSEGINKEGGLEKAKKLIVDGLVWLLKQAGGILKDVIMQFPLESAVVIGMTTGVIPGIATKLSGKLMEAILTRMMAGNAINAAVSAATGGAAAATGGVAAAAGGAELAGGAAAGGGGLAAAFAGPQAIIAIVVLIAAAIIIFQGPLLSLAQWFRDAGDKLAAMKNFAAMGLAMVMDGMALFTQGLVNIFGGLWDFVSGLFTGDIEKIKSGFIRFIMGIDKFFEGLIFTAAGIFLTAGGAVAEAIKNLFLAIASAVSDMWKHRPKWAGGDGGEEPPKTPAKAKAFGSPGVSFGSLGAAASYEMKHKPAGSGLVVANTSETVIPAAGGYGMADIIGVLSDGFSAMLSELKRQTQANDQAQKQQMAAFAQLNTTMLNNQIQTNAGLKNLQKAFSNPEFGGLGSGSVGGGVEAFTPMASGFGLTKTSGYRPGDPGWHGLDRARDYSNGTGPTPQMKRFALFMASRYGRNLKELIYTPLGWSIKNGRKVPPYARAQHYNHVHVAYGLGGGSPAFFTSRMAAQNWEASVAPRDARIASVTSNSSEFGTSVHAPITINQRPGEDSEDLARRVASELWYAFQDSRKARLTT